mmetsp:Transcript_4927/g.12573  ORF Transcript_4927/g.12573 Transcript_4927/m.12573 type:complete len:128 (-) Transcript_4927:373-756(-)
MASASVDVASASVYVKVNMHLGALDGGARLSAEVAADVTKAALTQSFGCVHGAVPFDVVFAVEAGAGGEGEPAAVIKVDARDRERLLAALALLSAYKGSACALRVTQVSHHLPPMLHNPQKVLAHLH